MKEYLQNDFTTGNNLYPKYRPQTIYILDQYSKIVVTKTSTPERSSFAQGDDSKVKGGKGGDNKSSTKSIGGIRSAMSVKNSDTQHPTLLL